MMSYCIGFFVDFVSGSSLGNKTIKAENTALLITKLNFAY